MIKTNKILLTVLLFTFFFPIISHGEVFDFEINANSTDVEGKLNARIPVYGTYLSTGTGILLSDDDDTDYWIANINSALKDNIMMEALSLGLGFKGILGQANIDDENFNLRAFSFLALGEYDFRRTNLKLPLSLYANYAMSPAPLNFSDTKKYQQFTFVIYGHIVGNAAVVAGYRNIDAQFDADPDEIDHEDDAYYFGIKLAF